MESKSILYCAAVALLVLQSVNDCACGCACGYGLEKCSTSLISPSPFWPYCNSCSPALNCGLGLPFGYAHYPLSPLALACGYHPLGSCGYHPLGSCGYPCGPCGYHPWGPCGFPWGPCGYPWLHGGYPWASCDYLGNCCGGYGLGRWWLPRLPTCRSYVHPAITTCCKHY